MKGVTSTPLPRSFPRFHYNTKGLVVVSVTTYYTLVFLSKALRFLWSTEGYVRYSENLKVQAANLGLLLSSKALHKRGYLPY